MTATQMFNNAHFLSGFDYTIGFRSTKAHTNANSMFRFPNQLPPRNQIDKHEIDEE